MSRMRFVKLCASFIAFQARLRLVESIPEVKILVRECQRLQAENRKLRKSRGLTILARFLHNKGFRTDIPAEAAAIEALSAFERSRKTIEALKLEINRLATEKLNGAEALRVKFERYEKDNASLEAQCAELSAQPREQIRSLQEQIEGLRRGEVADARTIESLRAQIAVQENLREQLNASEKWRKETEADSNQLRDSLAAEKAHCESLIVVLKNERNSALFQQGEAEQRASELAQWHKLAVADANRLSDLLVKERAHCNEIVKALDTERETSKTLTEALAECFDVIHRLDPILGDEMRAQLTELARRKIPKAVSTGVAPLPPAKEG